MLYILELLHEFCVRLNLAKIDSSTAYEHKLLLMIWHGLLSLLDSFPDTQDAKEGCTL